MRAAVEERALAAARDALKVAGELRGAMERLQMDPAFAQRNRHQTRSADFDIPGKLDGVLKFIHGCVW